MSDCIFCKIADGSIKGDIVYQDELVTAFRDLKPQAPVHVLIIPNKHLANITELDDSDRALAAHIFVDVVPKLAEQLGVDKSGFRLVVNTGKHGGQTVHHLHVHLLGGRGMKWPPG